MRIAEKLRNLAIVFFTVFAVGTVAYAQAKKPLTSDDLIQMHKAGIDDKMAVNAIGANGVALDTSVQGIVALKSAGVGDTVINAALAAATAKAPSGAAAEQDKGVPDEIGAYAVIKDVLTPLPVEVVNMKTAGMLGAAFTYGIKKAKLQGTVNGSKSSTQTAAPVMLVLKCADGTAPTEYQLVALDVKKDSREFTEAKMSMFGASTGVNKDALSVKFEKIGRNAYKATLSGLSKGEYGILAPGALASANGASSGKLYTFGILE